MAMTQTPPSQNNEIINPLFGGTWAEHGLAWLRAGDFGDGWAEKVYML